MAIKSQNIFFGFFGVHNFISSLSRTMTTSEAAPEATTAPKPAPEASGTEMLSPNAMARAVLDQAVLERGSQQHQQSSESETLGAQDSNDNKRARDNDENHDEQDVTKKLKQVWEGNNDKDEAVVATLALVNKEIESLIRSGLQAYHGWESAKRDLSQAKEELQAKDRELRRLQASEEQSRATITNLLKTVEMTKSNARDASRVIQVEARLRADLSHLRAERNEALAEAAQAKRKAELLEEDLRTTKAKHSKVVQEKIKMERDSRAAINLARSLDTHASSDCDFYKRKVCYVAIVVLVLVCKIKSSHVSFFSTLRFSLGYGTYKQFADAASFGGRTKASD